jgi:branched-chain amino acid aminotransferase
MKADAIACVDGVTSSLERARIPAIDRGFLYGDAVFEALRTFGRVPDALDRHLARLERSCAILGFTLGVARAALAEEVQRTIALTAGPEVYLRIMVTRGDAPEALAPRGARQPRRVVIARSLTPPALDRVACVALRSYVAPPSPLWAGAKPTAYINNLLALGGAQASGADDALLLGAHGELLEGATSSVFLVSRGGELLTPPVQLGILPGITRERVLRCAERLGLAPRERLLTIHDAYRASELFLTSSVRGLVGVSAVDGVRVGDPVPGPLTCALFEAYRAEVAGP